MSDSTAGNDSDGCATLGGCLAITIVIALVVSVLISLAALVDPFSWMPPVDAVWADCEDDYGTDRDECALANRFPGFWVHAIVNLGYTVAGAMLAAAFVGSVIDLRTKQIDRFAGPDAAAEHRSARGDCLAAGSLLAALAALPIVVAVV